MSKFATFTVWSLLVLGQGAPSPFTPGTAELSWDALTIDINGNAATPAKYEVAVTLRTADLNATNSALKSVEVVSPRVDKTLAAALFNGLAMGEYRVWVRAISTGNLKGQWSDPLLVVLQPTAVIFGKVQNLRVIELPAGTGALLIIPANP